MNTTYITTTNPPYHDFKPENHSSYNKPTSNFSQKSILDILNTNCNTSLKNLKQAHALVLKTGHFQDHYVAGTLVKLYANPQFKNLDFAINVFNHVHKPNVFVWNSLLKACLDHNEPSKAVYFYSKLMEAANSRGNKFTYPTLLKACSVSNSAKEGEQIHGYLVKVGMISRDLHVKSAAIQMYASVGCVVEARRLLDHDGGNNPDVVCWNAMLDGYFKYGDSESAKELFSRIPSKNIGSWNAMISGFAKLGMIQEARKVFDEMSDKDEITWSAMVDGYIQSQNYKEALNVFNEMQTKTIRPKKFILSSVLSACANLAAIDQGRWIHGYIRKNSIRIDAVLGTGLVDMYLKCGYIDVGRDVFDNMKDKKVFSWNAMIGGLATHGRAEEAFELFSKMVMMKGIRPDEITFIALLNACAHAGLVEKGLSVLNSMKSSYGIEPRVEHYGCVVDLLGRSGLMTEAEEVIRSMPMEPNAAVWGALLGACRIHRNVELGEKVGEILLEMEPRNGGRYACLSNIYASAKRWDDVEKVRKLMKQRGVKTNPGISSVVDSNGNVHEFKTGDESHPETEKIYSTLESVIETLKTNGYSPNTSRVLFDIDEEEKENALKYHSEKLAIAFALINTNPGTTIRVVKNLRVCEDCHSATKLVSQVYGRDIIVRDRVRYHHFKNGECSCNDFW